MSIRRLTGGVPVTHRNLGQLGPRVGEHVPVVGGNGRLAIDVSDDPQLALARPDQSGWLLAERALFRNAWSRT